MMALEQQFDAFLGISSSCSSSITAVAVAVGAPVGVVTPSVICCASRERASKDIMGSSSMDAVSVVLSYVSS